MPQGFAKAREPISSLSHFVGAVLSCVGLALVVLKLFVVPGITGQTAAAAFVFCLSLIALYSASSIYHFSLAGERILKRLKKLDHSMIYVLIAGSYTPVMLRFLPAPRSYWFLTGVWAVALFGIAAKLLWINAPRFLGTVLYLVLGWSILADRSVFSAMPVPALVLLATGGVCYTIGGVIYLLKKPNWSRVFGFHELFHMFVLAGSLCHFVMVFGYVL